MGRVLNLGGGELAVVSCSVGSDTLAGREPSVLLP